MKASDLPSFKSIPAVEGMPHGCTWGLWDKDGKRDQIGTLNLLTPEVILAAKEEIKAGISVSINWPLHKCHHPGFSRKVPEHRVFAFPGGGAHDDEIHINTQSGSQWDGLKHFAHTTSSGSKLYYNNLPASEVPTTTDNGIHHWHEDIGCIVGRGILLDYVRYAARKGISYDVMTRHQIPVAALEEMAAEQGVEFRAGDILIVRSGFTKWYESASQEERDEKIKGEGRDGEKKDLQWAGVEGSLETVEWLWDHHFAAVAGDGISWEQWPFTPDCAIHEYQLAFWGSPIGEIWDLEKLAEVCEQQKRWTFFFTSAPLNVVGGVASPPNAVCIL